MRLVFALMGEMKLRDTAKRATTLGFVAISLWTVEPLLISEINVLPIFEVLAIIFFSSFLMTAFRLTKQKRWHLVKQPLYIWLAGFLGICASDFAYIHGAQHAPIAHVDLIDYLWPCLVIVFTCMLPKERFSSQHLIGVVLGFLGIFTLIHHELNLNGLSIHHIIGYSLALLGALLWGGYSAFSRHHQQLPTEMIGLYCGLGAIVSLALHLKFETFVMPSCSQGLMAILTGITGAGIAYQLWDFGIKFGNIYLLSSATYIARIAAMVLLVLFGKEPFTLSLVLACLLTSLGVFMSSLESTSFKNLCQKTIYLISNPFRIRRQNPI